MKNRIYIVLLVLFYANIAHSQKNDRRYCTDFGANRVIVNPGFSNNAARLIVTYIILLLFTACDVHEWPETTGLTKIHLQLSYETDMIEWEHSYNNGSVTELGIGETYDNLQEKGHIRYIIRCFPISVDHRIKNEYTYEFVHTKDLVEGYDHKVTIDIAPGNYEILVWSDFVEINGDNQFYNADNFAEVTLQGKHTGNTDYRDSFSGKGKIQLSSNSINQAPETIYITMKRPLAKFEIRASDLSDFIVSGADNLDLYTAKVQYTGYMPNAYSIFTNKPVDSTIGTIFESTLNQLNDSEISIGFDYVLVGDRETEVTIRIGFYDNKGVLVSTTETIVVPLKPSHHTILTGKFSMQKEKDSEGVSIDPGFSGEHNFIL